MESQIGQKSSPGSEGHETQIGMYNYQADKNPNSASSLGKKSCEPSADNGVAKPFPCEESIVYLNEIRLAEAEKYDAFVNIMKEFKALRIDADRVVGRVNDLFKENPHLIKKLERFFPKSDEITPNAKKEPLPGIVVTYDNALGLTRSIMERFPLSANRDVLESLMDILGLFIKGSKSFIQVSEEVPSLFKGHPDLVHKFCTFLPVSSGEMKRLLDDNMYLDPKSNGTSGVVAVNGGTSGAASEQKLNVSGPRGVAVASPAAAAGSKKKLTSNDAMTYLEAVKYTLEDQGEKYDQFLNVMKDFKAQRVGIPGLKDRVKELFKGYPSLILGFNLFLPMGYEMTLTDEEEAPQKRRVELEDAISFVTKVKKRFTASVHIYQSFIDLLNGYRNQQMGIVVVYQQVETLFKDHPDLLDEFTRFIPVHSRTALDHGSCRNSDMDVCDDKDSPKSYEDTISAMTSLLVSAAVHVQSYNFCCIMLSKL